MHGALWVLLADALFVPTGVLTSAFLTRWLGPHGYGVYALSVALGMWVEWGILAAFSRATIKFVGESEDWRAVGATALRVNLVVALAGGLLISLSSPLAGRLFSEPALVAPLCAYGLTVLMVVVASVHSQILVGRGDFGPRAVVSAVYALTRMALVIVLVLAGLGPTGAVLGLAAASTVSLMLARRYIRPSLQPSDFPWQSLIAYAVPLFLFSMGQRVLGYVDLVMLKLLGSSTVSVGYFSAAQNVALAMNFLVLAVTPLLLSELTRALRDAQRDQAQTMIVTAFRLMLIAVPITALVGGCAGEVLMLVSGASYLPAAPLVLPLAGAALMRSLTVIVTTMQVAIGEPRLPAQAVLPLVPVTLLAQVLIVPLYGAIGAATVTFAVSAAAAALSLVLLHRHWPLTMRWATLARCLALSFPAYWLAESWPVEGVLVIAKLMVLGVTLLLALAATGEFRREDLALLRALRAPAPRLAPGRQS